MRVVYIAGFISAFLLQDKVLPLDAILERQGGCRTGGIQGDYQDEASRITTEQAWKKFWTRVKGKDGGKPPAVDFERHMVVALLRRCTGAHKRRIALRSAGVVEKGALTLRLDVEINPQEYGCANLFVWWVGVFPRREEPIRILARPTPADPEKPVEEPWAEIR